VKRAVVHVYFQLSLSLQLVDIINEKSKQRVLPARARRA
jgi:hypothetical protein